ncbi:MAG: flgL [Bacteriovoracaceae bacterium]|nr:flgL [Bacteriovoracaceae bacterium]
MGMRLTGLSNFLLFQNAIAGRNSDLYKTSEQLSTQKRINRPSDNPQGASDVLAFKQDIDKITQYSQNLTVADRSLKDTETTLSSVKDLITKAKELALQGNNGTQSQSSRDAIADQIQQLQQQMVVFSNSNIEGQYIFGGYRTDNPPFTLNASQPAANPVVTYNGDTNTKSVQISDSSNLQIQSRGDQVFKGDGTANTVDLFQTMADLETALRAGNVTSDPSSTTNVGSQLTKLDTGLNQVLNELTTIGASENRVTTTQDFLTTQTETLKSFVSSIEDVDMATVAFDYQKSTTALQATINAAGTIMHLPSLIDFLKT